MSPGAPLALVGRKHPALHTAAAEVEDYDAAARLAGRMVATLRRQHGLGLAAPQVGRGIQLIVARHEDDGALRELANPTILEYHGKVEESKEGCLSLPGRWFLVPRHTTVIVAATDLDGNETAFRVKDQFARLWQHELDHLHGQLLLGRFPELRG